MNTHVRTYVRVGWEPGTWGVGCEPGVLRVLAASVGCEPGLLGVPAYVRVRKYVVTGIAVVG